MSAGVGYYESLQTDGYECKAALEKTMLYERETPEAASQASRHVFAESLVTSLDCDGALQIRRDNGWGDIFDTLLDAPVSRWNQAWFAARAG